MKTTKKVERQRSLVYRTLLSFGIAVFVSCTENPPPPSPQRVAIEPSPAPLRKQRAVPLPARKPTPPPENAATVSQSGDEAVALAAPESPPPEARPPPESPPPESPPPLDRNKLVGLDQPAARRLLGAATEQSEAPPATIWRYRTANCELDLFFYLDLRSGKMRSLHYAFKGGQGGGEECLRSVVAARGS